MKYSAMKHITLIVLFALSYGGVAAQDNISKTSNVLLPEMRADCTFLHVLDSGLVVEHTEKYYKNNFRYGISFFLDQHGKSCVQIEAIGRRVLRIGNEQGILNYKNHTFIIYGKFNNSILKPTGKMLIFDFAVNQTKTMDDGTVLLDGIEQDRFSVWIFRYDGELRLIKHSGISKP